MRLKKKFLTQKLTQKVNEKTDRTIDEAISRIGELRVERDLDDKEKSLMDGLEDYLKRHKAKWID